jgi:hypothetical protein
VAPRSLDRLDARSQGVDFVAELPDLVGESGLARFIWPYRALPNEAAEAGDDRDVPVRRELAYGSLRGGDSDVELFREIAYRRKLLLRLALTGVDLPGYLGSDGLVGVTGTR